MHTELSVQSLRIVAHNVKTTAFRWPFRPECADNHVAQQRKGHLDVKQNNPLYNADDKNKFYDQPFVGGTHIVTGASGFNTILGIADAKNRTFHVKGAMSWGYSVDRQGNVHGIPPHVANPDQLRKSLDVVRSESGWKIQ
jgi:hypothetical protein